MKLCKVLGSTVSTIKHPAYTGKKLLVVQPLGLDMMASGPSFLASDSVGAGAGEVVLVCEEGRSAMQVFETPERTPLRSAVVAIVDRVDLVGDEGQPVTHLFDAALSAREAGRSAD
jgi:microcompartment protein CcmK/EutM